MITVRYNDVFGYKVKLFLIPTVATLKPRYTLYLIENAPKLLHVRREIGFICRKGDITTSSLTDFFFVLQFILYNICGWCFYSFRRCVIQLQKFYLNSVLLSNTFLSELWQSGRHGYWKWFGCVNLVTIREEHKLSLGLLWILRRSSLNCGCSTLIWFIRRTVMLLRRFTTVWWPCIVWSRFFIARIDKKTLEKWVECIRSPE